MTEKPVDIDALAERLIAQRDDLEPDFLPLPQATQPSQVSALWGRHA